ncbi:hypothetical protein DFH94DRAFT_181535 [Russula ochroleuca]|uniref:Uncharacterized protein n=1 Tax=Russula ochroleuca TaxID=152965 RepID=A0A9P5N550_9AGAM|nr:hypothetical protein DFH94DRAFT_181535 [Russula ochroleuca]
MTTPSYPCLVRINVHTLALSLLWELATMACPFLLLNMQLCAQCLLHRAHVWYLSVSSCRVAAAGATRLCGISRRPVYVGMLVATMKLRGSEVSDIQTRSFNFKR